MITNLFSESSLALLVALSPALYALTAVMSWFQPGSQPTRVISMSKVAAVMGIVMAAIAAIMVYEGRLLISQSVDYQGLGISLRLDALSILIFAMINLIALWYCGSATITSMAPSDTACLSGGWQPPLRQFSFWSFREI